MKWIKPKLTIRPVYPWGSDTGIGNKMTVQRHQAGGHNQGSHAGDQGKTEWVEIVFQADPGGGRSRPTKLKKGDIDLSETIEVPHPLNAGETLTIKKYSVQQVESTEAIPDYMSAEDYENFRGAGISMGWGKRTLQALSAARLPQDKLGKLAAMMERPRNEFRDSIRGRLRQWVKSGDHRKDPLTPGQWAALERDLPKAGSGAASRWTGRNRHRRYA